ncbi:hypothetical protein PDE_06832 [Penicillium oxalicum 114-2]|uniref:Uncharacterized protein n=1 Tax=Penicillium oxalicum (strain 114-2 / CGMCC 5302) TaxID=933388 RepID=S7ZNG8_PENO1|nr:hypothetical protein PDE_06832 [Penicillium oxalicum 114-2]
MTDAFSLRGGGLGGRRVRRRNGGARTWWGSVWTKRGRGQDGRREEERRRCRGMTRLMKKRSNWGRKIPVSAREQNDVVEKVVDTVKKICRQELKVTIPPTIQRMGSCLSRLLDHVCVGIFYSSRVCLRTNRSGVGFPKGFNSTAGESPLNADGGRNSGARTTPKRTSPVDGEVPPAGPASKPPQGGRDTAHDHRHTFPLVEAS